MNPVREPRTSGDGISASKPTISTTTASRRDFRVRTDTIHFEIQEVQSTTQRSVMEFSFPLCDGQSVRIDYAPDKVGSSIDLSLVEASSTPHLLRNTGATHFLRARMLAGTGESVAMLELE